MVALAIESFNGIAPKIDARRLADDMATVAQNCVFDHNNLRPLKSPSLEGTTIPANTLSFYRYQNAWITSPSRLNGAPSPLANDPFDRLYISTPAYPVVKSGADVFRLGLPRPITVTAVASQVPDPDDAAQLLTSETVFYAFSIVDGFGSEGPLSLPSEGIDRIRDTAVTITFPANPVGAYNFSAAARKRIYRTNSGTTEAVWQFVADILLVTMVFEDIVLNEELGELAPSAEWIGPPDDDVAVWPDGPLQGMVNIGNGVLAGFSGRSVYFCAPYLPHAWPLEYRITEKYPVLAIAPVTGGVLVVTLGKPFFISGVHPASMSVSRPETDLAGVNALSVVDMGEYAMFATTQGLAMASGGEITLVTEDLFDRDTWALYQPTTIIGGVQDGRYVGFYGSGETAAGFIFDPRGGKAAFTTTSVYSESVFQHPDGTLYIKQGTDIGKWDNGAMLTYKWKSKQFTVPEPVNFGWLEMLATPLAGQLTIFHGEASYSFVLTQQYHVLPEKDVTEKWIIQIEGTATVVLISLIEELGD